MSNNFNTLASSESLDKTVSALSAKGYEAIVVENAKEALEKIKNLVPKGASIMNGASVTLEQIGFIDFLKSGNHGWNNMHEEIASEKDPVKQSQLRMQAQLSDYYLGSVHALVENGEFVIASNTGSQLPHVVFTSPNLIFVVGTQKIVPDVATAMERLEKYVVPMENEHMMQKYNMGTHLNKVVIFKGESSSTQRKIEIVLIKEILGF